MEDNQNDKKYIIEIKSGLYVSTNAFEMYTVSLKHRKSY